MDPDSTIIFMKYDHSQEQANKVQPSDATGKLNKDKLADKIKSTFSEAKKKSTATMNDSERYPDYKFTKSKEWTHYKQKAIEEANRIFFEHGYINDEEIIKIKSELKKSRNELISGLEKYSDGTYFDNENDQKKMKKIYKNFYDSLISAMDQGRNLDDLYDRKDFNIRKKTALSQDSILRFLKPQEERPFEIQKKEITNSLLENKIDFKDASNKLKSFLETGSIWKIASRFISVSTLSIININKYKGKNKIKSLKQALEDFPKKNEIENIKNISDDHRQELLQIRANLEFVLAMTILANKPNAKARAEAKDFLESSAELCPLSKMTLNFNFKGFDYNEERTVEEGEAIKNEFKTHLESLGLSELIDKRDINEILNYRTAKTASKSRKIEILTKVIFALALPITWTSVTLGILTVAAGMLLGDVIAFVTFPIWMIPMWILCGCPSI